MGIEYRKTLKKRATRGDDLPHSISKAMIERAQKAAARNKARIDDGQTFRAHQHTDRDAPSRKRSGQYS
ncbi:hypothetical protein [Bifidobacterium sp. ESL0704]|uniref:hypothetical protein n=1 Tax=Bifidobacterium sp. ESL0704 TaxID=2983219 RepID=UPI0023F7066A|nr:hypothetical protein [Bifidobacterium sp. ESL0704]WEV53346.1 hypothetical protein OZX64_02340 [Bifidobacterium sp. ESL0704]